MKAITTERNDPLLGVTDTTNAAAPFPEGNSYWALSKISELDCQRASDEGESATDAQIIDGLGTVVSLLYRMSCCHWGCHGKEHILEYLAGRTCTAAHGAMRLIGFGYYDEALSLVRTIAEIGNLVSLFYTDPSHIRQWLDLPEKERRRKYTPIKVRIALEDLGSAIPTDEERYDWLCDVGTHVNPRTLPQNHNDEGRPILGSVFQPKGRSVTLEALAWAVSTVAGPMAKTAVLGTEPARRLFNASIALIESLPDSE